MGRRGGGLEDGLRGRQRLPRHGQRPDGLDAAGEKGYIVKFLGAQDRPARLRGVGREFVRVSAAMRPH
jgi:hypothetical protein